MTLQTVVIVFCVLCLGATMIAVERLRPGRAFPKVRGWLARAIAINAFQVLAVYLAGLLWNHWMVVIGLGVPIDSGHSLERYLGTFA